MPNKYSHSVVLAQQSSSGLISLPNDQYIDYLRSSPLLTTKPTPQRPSTAPSKNRSRATSTKTSGSERSAVQNSLREQICSDQLAAGPYRHQARNWRIHGTARHLIVDAEEEDDDHHRSDIESQSSWQSSAASSTRSPNTNLRQKRLPHRLPIELDQQVMQDGLLSRNSHNPQRVQQKSTPQTVAYSEPDIRPSVELPIQIRAYSGVLQARSRVSAAPSHNRDISNAKSLATPQLSPTSTEMTHQEDSPATPFSSLQRAITPAMADEQRFHLDRENSASLRHTRIFRPAPTKMPLQANFDGFFDEYEPGGCYFKDMPEPAEPRKSRLMNMRAYNAMERAINDSPIKETFGSDKNFPAVPNGDLGLQLPPQNRYRDRFYSLSSSSSLGEFGIGIPSVSQTTGRPKTSAAVMKTDSQIRAHQALFEASIWRNQTQFSEITKTKTPRSHPSLPDFSQAFRRQFDPSLLDPTASSLSQFLSGPDSRLSESDSDTAAPPPDIARHPPAVHHDPPSQLNVDSRRGWLRRWRRRGSSSSGRA